MENKFILDACCGGRMMWFIKNHPNCLYVDIRKEEKGHITSKSSHEVNPDLIADFRKLPIPDKSFKLVVFDPPHRTDFTPTALMAKQYGILPEAWQDYIKKGFNECWRVLEDFGVLIFKWNEKQIKLKKVLAVISQQPLLGNQNGVNGKTHWLVFMKIPK